MSETAKRDPNYVTTLMGVSLSDGETPTNVYVDESTHRMLVSAIITGGSPTGTEYTEGDVDTTFSGFMMMAEGAGNVATPVQIDADGKLLVSASVSASITFFADGLNFSAGTSEGIPVMGVYESSPTTVTDGDLAIAGLTSDRRLKTSAAITTSVLPTGAATSANQSTIIGHVDGIEGLLTTIDADTGNMVTSLQLIDNAVATISSTDVIRVALFDASDNQVTSFGGGTQYTEGDTDSSITGTAFMWEDGSDTLRAVSAAKPLPISVATIPSHAVTNAGTFAVQVDGSALTALQNIDSDTTTIIGHVDGIETLLTAVDGHVDGIEGLLTTIDADTGNIATAASAIQTSVELIDDAIKADDAAFTPGTTKVMMAGFEYDDTGTDSVDEGDAGAARMSANRNVYTQIRDAAGNERGANVNASGQLSVIDANSASALTALQNIDSDTTTIIGHVDGIETLLTAIDGHVDGLETSNSAIQTSVELIDDTVKVLGTDTYTEATSKGVIIGGVRRDADTTLANTTNEFAPFQLDANGYLKVEIFDGGGSHTVDNNGTFVVQENGSALTALQLIDDTVFTDDGTFTPGTSKVNAIGLQADETSTDSVDEGDIGAPRMTLDRKQIVTLQPHTAGGWSTANMTSGDTFTALTNSAQAIKASAGKLGGWYIYNPNATAAYVIIYNIAHGSVTVGTSTPKLVLCIPATSAANLEMSNGIEFDTAISAAAATTGGGNSAPSTALEANFWYK